MLDLNKIKNILTDGKSQLIEKYCIAAIGQFGSLARDDFNENSDIDIIVDFYKPIGIEFITLAEELEAKLNRKVDLVSRKGIKPKYFKVIEPEIIYI